MRKQVVSFTLDKTTEKVLTAIAATEADMNKSEALRRIVAEAGASRGLCRLPAVAKMADSEVNHAA